MLAAATRVTRTALTLTSLLDSRRLLRATASGQLHRLRHQLSGLGPLAARALCRAAITLRARWRRHCHLREPGIFHRSHKTEEAVTASIIMCSGSNVLHRGSTSNTSSTD